MPRASSYATRSRTDCAFLALEPQEGIDEDEDVKTPRNLYASVDHGFNIAQLGDEDASTMAWTASLLIYYCWGVVKTVPDRHFCLYKNDCSIYSRKDVLVR
jgi:hypothetical protein